MTDDDSAVDPFDPIVGDQRDVVSIAADCNHVSVAIGEPVRGTATVTLSRPDARNALNATGCPEFETYRFDNHTHFPGKFTYRSIFALAFVVTELPWYTNPTSNS